MSTLLPAHFEQIRSQVASCLQQNYDRIAESLSTSSSKWAKVAGKAAKVTLIVNKIYNAVSEGVKIVDLILAINQLVDKELMREIVVGGQVSQTSSDSHHKQKTTQQRSNQQSTVADFDSEYDQLDLSQDHHKHDKQSQPKSAPSKGKSGRPSNPESSSETVGTDRIEQELSQIEGVFLSKLEMELQQKLKGALEQIIRGSLKKVAKAAKKAASKCVKKAFKGKSSSEVVKDLHSKRTQQTVVEDHPESIRASHPDEQSRLPPPEADQQVSSYQKLRDDFDKKIADPNRPRLLGGNPDAASASGSGGEAIRNHEKNYQHSGGSNSRSGGGHQPSGEGDRTNSGAGDPTGGGGGGNRTHNTEKHYASDVDKRTLERTWSIDEDKQICQKDKKIQAIQWHSC